MGRIYLKKNISKLSFAVMSSTTNTKRIYRNNTLEVIIAIHYLLNKYFKHFIYSNGYIYSEYKIFWWQREK